MSAFPAQKIRCTMNVFVTLAVLLFLSALPALGFDSEQGYQTAVIPDEYGRVIYQKNGQARNQIYIIGQAHRSGVDGRNNESTVQAQVEIYRIGEWLIRQKGVELLLPEGFFQRHNRTYQASPVTTVHYDDLPSPDSRYLRTRLEDTRRFVNADTLLHEQYPVRLAQVEDEQIYRTVANLLRDLGQQQDRLFFEQLDDLQSKRTVAMLQNIPSAVEQEFQRGGLESKNAIFTIGMAHIAEIIDLLSIEAASLDGAGERSANNVLDLLDEEYGVTVILPRSLAENERVLRLTQLSGLATKL